MLHTFHPMLSTTHIIIDHMSSTHAFYTIVINQAVVIFPYYLDFIQIPVSVSIYNGKREMITAEQGRWQC
jgi:hypothetical protein